MAADTFKIYENAKEYMCDGTMDLDGDSFKAALFLSTSNAATLGVGTGLLADLTNEHAGANGYTTGGVAISSVTWVESAGTVTFDFADPTWTASGGSIIARFNVVYDDTPTSPADPLVGYTLMDNTPADITVTDGGTLTIQIHASGMFDLSGGT